MPKFPVIAIDGPAGSGKSTAARLLARRLGFTHVDTGALYRTVTLLAIDRGVRLEDEAALAAIVPDIAVRFEPTDAGQRVFSGSRDVSAAIRTPELTRQVRFAAASPLVRAALVPVQRAFADAGGCVMEGRDIGSVIFPDAAVKFYLDAPLTVRAERRWKELRAAGQDVALDEVRREEAARDESDLRRATAPLCKARNAIAVNTTGLTVEGMVDRLTELAIARLERINMGSAFYRFACWICRVVARTFFRQRVQWMDNVPVAGGIVLASNHQSFLDPPLVGCMIPRQCRFLARSNLFMPPFGWLLDKLGAVPVERGSSDVAGIRRAVELLRAGEVLILFPEGTRSDDGYLKEVLSGTAAVAIRAGVPVMPAYVHGSFEAWPRKRRLPRPTRVLVLYGPPIRLSQAGGGSHKEQIRNLTALLQTALEDLQRRAFEIMPLGDRSAPDARKGAGNDGPAPASSPVQAANGARQSAASETGSR